MILCSELLESILSDAIPFLVKKHYINLLYEVYLRQVPGIDEGHRLPIGDVKLQQVFKWIIQYDLEHSFNHYKGLIVESKPNDTPE